MPLRRAVVCLMTFTVAACSSPADAVRTNEDAIAIAKAEWGVAFVAGRKLRSARENQTWVIQREWRAGDATEEAILIDARTGQAKRSSTTTGTVVWNRR